jgi:hypothetical protein
MAASSAARRIGVLWRGGPYVLELSSDDGQLTELAREAVDTARTIREADSRDDMETRSNDARMALEKVIVRARLVEPGRDLVKE